MLRPNVTYGWGQPAMLYREPVPEEVSSLTLEVPPAALECMPHMSAFYNSPLLSDVLLESGDGQPFHCHRLLLAAWSQPLCIMLTGGMVEARQQQVSLPHVSGEILELLLRFMYWGSCQLPTELLMPLLAVADQYDVAALTRLCREALAHHGRNYKSCLRFWRGARAAGLPHLAQEAWQLLREPHTWVALMTDKQTRDALTTDEEEELYQLEVQEEVQLATSAVSRAHIQHTGTSSSSSSG